MGSSSNMSHFASVSFVENCQFIRLSLDLHGVAAKDLTVELQRGVLVIRGSREVKLRPGLRHEHKFCRRFAIDTDVVNIERFQANLNQQGVLTVMAPKMRLPTTVQVAVTVQDDETFLTNVAKSWQEQQDEKEQASAEEEDKKKEVVMVATAEAEERDAAEEDKDTGKTKLNTEAAALPNVVSMGSASEALDRQSELVSVNRRHKSSMKSHLMVRRSMRNTTDRKRRNAAWAR